jgi:hypothetical protein
MTGPFSGSSPFLFLFSAADLADRLYLLPKSDDASHDEALSSRVAALNMLDLGLEHLGVDVGVAGAGVTAVLKACGESAHLESSDSFFFTHSGCHLQRFPGSRTWTLDVHQTKLLYWS